MGKMHHVMLIPNECYISRINLRKTRGFTPSITFNGWQSVAYSKDDYLTPYYFEASRQLIPYVLFREYGDSDLISHTVFFSITLEDNRYITQGSMMSIFTKDKLKEALPEFLKQQQEMRTLMEMSKALG